MEPSGLEKSIITTVAYFAHFTFPLTTLEVWKWLITDEEVAFSDVDRTLRESPWLAERIDRYAGYCGMGDVVMQVEERRSRYADAMAKYRKVARYAKLLRWLPGAEGVAVCNSLAYHHTTRASDIDLFILTSPRHTWTVRLLATAPAVFLRQRPGECDEHPLCLSFFASTEAMDMAKLKIDDDDPYFAYWVVTLAPLFGREEYFTKLWHANSWIRQQMPNAYPVRRARAFRLSATSPAWRIPWVEAWAERLQRGRFPRVIRDMMNRDTRVVVSNTVLKFHENDRRAAIKAALRERLAAYGIDRRA